MVIIIKLQFIIFALILLTIGALFGMLVASMLSVSNDDKEEDEYNEGQYYE